MDKRPVFRLFLLLLSLTVSVHGLFNSFRYIFALVCIFAQLKKFPRRFSFNFLHLLLWFSFLYCSLCVIFAFTSIVTPWVTFGIAQCAHMLCVCCVEVCAGRLYEK